MLDLKVFSSFFCSAEDSINHLSSDDDESIEYSFVFPHWNGTIYLMIGFSNDVFYRESFIFKMLIDSLNDFPKEMSIIFEYNLSSFLSSTFIVDSKLFPSSIQFFSHHQTTSIVVLMF